MQGLREIRMLMIVIRLERWLQNTMHMQQQGSQNTPLGRMIRDSRDYFVYTMAEESGSRQPSSQSDKKQHDS